jgi:hypothetical protein
VPPEDGQLLFVANSHRRTVWSSFAVASILPSGEKARKNTDSPCPGKEPFSCPLIGFHNITLRSEPAEAKVLPSELKATQLTVSVCPWRIAGDGLAATSQSRAVVFHKLPEASVLPSGENPREWTRPLLA